MNPTPLDRGTERGDQTTILNLYVERETKSPTSMWRDAGLSAARLVNVFLTTEKRAPWSSNFVRTSSISVIVRPR